MVLVLQDDLERFRGFLNLILAKKMILLRRLVFNGKWRFVIKFVRNRHFIFIALDVLIWIDRPHEVGQYIEVLHPLIKARISCFKNAFLDLLLDKGLC